MVIDPELKLDELEHVQEQVVGLLSGQTIHENEPMLPLKNTQLSVSPIRRPRLSGFPDQAVIVDELEEKYTNGELWIWTELGNNVFEGVVIRSDGTKIYSSNE
jgi:hypothetical protein